MLLRLVSTIVLEKVRICRNQGVSSNPSSRAERTNSDRDSVSCRENTDATENNPWVMAQSEHAKIGRPKMIGKGYGGGA